MDIGKSFGFVFEDDRWITKILIGAAVLAVGFVFVWLAGIPLLLAFLLLAGYQVEVIRRVIHRVTPVLPEWDDWGRLLVEGIKFTVIGLVYALPAIAVGICLGVPMSLLGENGSGDPNWASVVFGGPLACLNILWAIFVALVLPAAVAFYVVNDDLAAAFRFGEIVRFVRKNLMTYILTAVMSWVAGLIGGLGIWLCLIGMLATYPYSIMVSGHLYGQAYLEASGQAAAAPITDLDDVAIS
ncbi:MAG: DUF4013 domain-containing protein [Anaerolineae bacterium]|nr:DUF4013 domain-containing protein [Anaerolineae bacterium]